MNPYPGINMDNLVFFAPIALKAHGQTMIHDWVFMKTELYTLLNLIALRRRNLS